MQQLLTKEKHEVIQYEVIQKYVVEIYLLTWKDVCNIVTNNIKSKLQTIKQLFTYDLVLVF